jgi:hypothetical protein
MSSVEALVLLPLLLTIIILNVVVADTLIGELEEVQVLKAKLDICLSNTIKIVNGSLPP